MANREIKLNGVNAVNFTRAADNGVDVDEWNVIQDNSQTMVYSIEGEHGVAGMAGAQGGQFFGIGQSIDTNWFEISVKGGIGGNGQDGGNGKEDHK